MEPSLLTSQTTAAFGSSKDLRMPIGVGREDSQSGRLSNVLALGPRLREDDGQGNWSLFSALRVRETIIPQNSRPDLCQVGLIGESTTAGVAKAHVEDFASEDGMRKWEVIISRVLSVRPA